MEESRVKVMKRASSDKRKGLPLKVGVYYCEDFVSMNRKEKTNSFR